MHRDHGEAWSCTLRGEAYPAVGRLADEQTIVGTWLSLVERTLGVGEVASSNLVVPTIYFQSVRVWKKVNERGRGSKKVHLLHAADLSSFLFLTNKSMYFAR